MKLYSSFEKVDREKLRCFSLSLEILTEEVSVLKRKVSEIEEITPERVVIGLGYTGVKLSTGHVGVCATPLNEILIEDCGVVKKAGSLSNQNIFALMEMAKSWDMGEAAVGIAAINAVSQIALERSKEEFEFKEGNLLDFLEIREDEEVAMIGKIDPFIPFLKKKTKKLYLFERDVTRRKDALPDFACEQYLPNSKIVIVTGVTVMNKTIGRILELTRNAKFIALVGPTASMYPAPFFKRGVSMMSGIITKNPDLLIRVIEEGGGTREFKKAVEFVNITKKEK